MAKKKTKETTEVTEIVETTKPVAKKSKKTKSASDSVKKVETIVQVAKKDKKAKNTSEVVEKPGAIKPEAKTSKKTKAATEAIEKAETIKPEAKASKKTKAATEVVDKVKTAETTKKAKKTTAIKDDKKSSSISNEPVVLEEVDISVDSESQEIDDKEKKKRGRPRKVLTPEEREKILENAKRQRGRPRKEKEEKPEKEVPKEKIKKGRKKVDAPKETHIPLRDESSLIQATLVKKQKEEKAAEQAFIEITPIPPKPNVRYSDEDLAIFEKRIQDFRKESIEELRMLRDRLDDLTNYDFAEESMIYSMHMAEQGSEALEKEKTYAQIQRINEYIKKLDDALQRIKEKTYGICRVCGCLIAKERLLAVPITTLSASYKIHKKCPEDGIDRIEQPAANNNSNGK